MSKHSRRWNGSNSRNNSRNRGTPFSTNNMMNDQYLYQHQFYFNNPNATTNSNSNNQTYFHQNFTNNNAYFDNSNQEFRINNSNTNMIDHTSALNPTYYSPIPSAPPTPFDPSYGATLLPSHLLMGSPFVSTPNIHSFPYSATSISSTPTRKSFSRKNSNSNSISNSNSSSMSNLNLNSKYDNYPIPPVPILKNPPLNNQNIRNSRNNSNRIRNNHIINRKLLKDDNSYRISQQTFKENPMIIEKPKYSSVIDINKLLEIPLVVSYKILPKGTDEFRTRSLLLENINQSIDTRTLVKNFINFGPIESVYLIKLNPGSKYNSILLSFVSREICLDFYNNVLQRLMEFKTELSSKSLTLSFVILKYEFTDYNHPINEHASDNGDESSSSNKNLKIDTIKEEEEDEEETDGEEIVIEDIRNDLNKENFPLTFASALQSDLVKRGATRSLLLKFNGVVSKDQLINEKLNLFINNNLNNRYILESISLVNIENNTKNNKNTIGDDNEDQIEDTPISKFGNNYCLLTFSNILMAIEAFDYFKAKLNELNIFDCFFVSKTNYHKNSENSKSTISHSTPSSKISSIVNLPNEINNNNKSNVPITSLNSDNDKSNVSISNDNISNDNTSNDNNNSNDNPINNNDITIRNKSRKNSNVTVHELSMDQEIEILNEKLKNIDLKDNELIISAKIYNQPIVEEFDQDLENISITNLSNSNYLLLNQQPFEFNMNMNMTMNMNMNMNMNVNMNMNMNMNMLPPQSMPMPMFAGNFDMIDPMDPQRSRQPSVLFTATQQPQQPQQQQPQQQGTHNNLTQTLENHFNTSTELSAVLGGGPGNRTVYIGNINPRSKPEDLCNVVRGGILQKIVFLRDKHICFVTFIEATNAAQFFANAYIDPIVLHGNILKVGWGNHSGPLPKSISLAVTIGANRNVYVSLPEFAFKDKFINNPDYEKYHEIYKLPNELQLRKDFSQYGEIEQINYLNDGHCCWINFMNINSAITLVEEVNEDDGIRFHNKFDGRYNGLIIGYGKDRCGNVNKNLVATKNSKFFKKVKKPAYQIKLKKIEEERRLQEENNLRNNNKLSNNSQIRKPAVNLESLGITFESSETDTTINTTNNDIDTPEDTQKLTSPATSFDDDHKVDPASLEALGIITTSATVAVTKNIDPSQINTDTSNHEDDETSSTDNAIEQFSNENEDEELDSQSSDDLSDVELIIGSGDNSDALTLENIDNQKLKKNKNKHNKRKVHRSHNQKILQSNQVPVLNQYPPMASSTLTRTYRKTKLKPKNDNPKFITSDTEDEILSQLPDEVLDEKNPFRGPRNKNKNRNTRKTIPGSDVMSQYLTQLQHSTFMYAANILGVSAEDNNITYGDDGEPLN
ncbi:hypothetical protein TBLA_0B03280 [Henningerozyma blattae CBS 6284]|uniref:RRM domain-containing protein n=1 Tax=Henningerozyma blattae (strain ATCC 34711 / CBS 6284 / DSM 70876 / NBRC 10599 / NRRL Y-10934 / UCD 77-7) TaxID=1071380 RepID=I2GYG7_HENB6|nr:hypothetical protein TBLA_0B03280 [Tetrapisispora blattae CBS 6284]CCH59169.1 hypothetical protein TBLA_0B03280 [Tetrapisispora blattae CBS 6284]